MRMLNWIEANLWRAAATLLLALVLALGGALFWQTNRIEGFVFVKGFEQKVAELEQSVKDERTAHQATKDTYTIAQRNIRLQHRVEVAEIEATQERITNDVASSYRRRLADLDQRVRQERARASAGGVAGGADLPADTDAAGRAAAAPGDLALSEREICVRQAIQLDELITWNIEQAGSDRFSGK